MTPLRPGVAAALLSACAAGCAGQANLHIVPLGGKSFDSATPLIQKITAHKCFYWVDAESERVHLSIRAHRPSLFGPQFSREFAISLVLDGLPAGATRQYRADRISLRAKYDAGLTHQRFASLTGVALIWDYGRARLKGRFRITAKRQSYLVLTGWGGDTGVLLLGDFTAAPGRRPSERIFAATESDGMNRANFAAPLRSAPNAREYDTARPISPPPPSDDPSL